MGRNLGNQPVLVQINLMDYHTEQELTGAVLRITDETGQRVAEVETIHDQNPVIPGIGAGQNLPGGEAVGTGGL